MMPVEEAKKRLEAARLVLPRPTFPDPGPRFLPNPSLELYTLPYAELLGDSPSPAETPYLVYHHPEAAGDSTAQALVRQASLEDLLALKLVAEDLTLTKAAERTSLPAATLFRVLSDSAHNGLLLAPAPVVMRAKADFPGVVEFPKEYTEVETFSLQWHITQHCDLSCKHCYDRSPAPPVSLDDGLAILDQFAAFCLDRNLFGQVTFTGGNPLLHPHFFDFYAEAGKRGLSRAILGNPCSAETLDRILALGAPAFFQASLEGLREHNDAVRGLGHFDRTLAFLDLLRERGVYSMIMATLTKANAGQLVALAWALKGRVDSFTFNRLSSVGEGAALEPLPPDELAPFLEAWLSAALENEHMRLKENLFAPLLAKRGLPQFGGCTGFGCGAAFNFLALTADGTVHACRKHPSPLGNALTDGLAAVYESEAARRVRQRPLPCRDCEHALVCGGCAAVTASRGLDPLRDKDPYCPCP